MFEDIGNIVNAIGNLIIQMYVCVYLVYIQKGKNSEIVYSYLVSNNNNKLFFIIIISLAVIIEQ